jgi:hypothetical protein
MKITCAWCESTIVASNNPIASVSHGICVPCKAKYDREIAALRADECDSFIDNVTVEEMFHGC